MGAKMLNRNGLAHASFGVRLLVGLVFILALGGMSAEAKADTRSNICRYDSRGASVPNMKDCPTEATLSGGAMVIDTAFDGIRANAGPWYGHTPINVWGHCRYVDNISSSSDSFVPFKTKVEWESFIQHHPTDILQLTPCALPYHYVHAFGPTSVEFNNGDKGDPQYADADLPYARTGTSLQMTHVFNNSCYEDKSVSHCWNEGTCCDEKGSCSPCCLEEGTQCTQVWHDWSETWTFTAFALDSETSNPSWSGSSVRTGGATRPSACLTRCTQQGHSCSCTTQPQAPEACTLPDPVLVSTSCVLLGGISGSGPVFEVNYALVIINYQVQIQKAEADGNCALASQLQTDLNNIVTGVNKSCDDFWTLNPQFHIPTGM